MAIVSVGMDAEVVNAHQRAREIIRRKGFRRGWVAEQLGISVSLLSLRLAGHRGWPEGWDEALADVLGVPVGELR